MTKKSLNVREFEEYIHNKKVICFGVGNHGRRMLDILDSYNKLDDLIAFIDNDSKKWNTSIAYEKFSYPIVSLKEGIQLLRENVVLVITCLDFLGIEAQLNMYDELRDFTYVSLVEVGYKQLICSDYKEIVKESEVPIIPKKIHYVWLGGKMPDNIKKNIEEWKRICPEYEFFEWNETNYDVCSNQYMKQAYDHKIWGFVSDYMRLDIIYKYGGIYMDVDVKMLKKPDDLLYQECFGSCSGTLLMDLGSGFGARARCEIIRELRDYYDNISFIRNDGSADKTSCMMHSYAVLKKYHYKVNDCLQNVGGMNIYPMIMQGACAYVNKMRITDKTYFVHYGTNTWLDISYDGIRDRNKKYCEEEGSLMTYDFRR